MPLDPYQGRFGMHFKEQNEFEVSPNEKQGPRRIRNNSSDGNDRTSCFFKIFSCGRTNVLEQKPKQKKKY